MSVTFSFDPVKREANRKKHGLDLADAKGVIEFGRTGRPT
jgi:uncharacterized DUF497 family protein